MKIRSVWWLLAGLVLIVGACSSKSSGTTPSPAGGKQALNVFAGGSDFAVGENRLSIFLVDFEGKALENMTAEVAFGPVQQDGKVTARQTAPAAYKPVVTKLTHTHADGKVESHDNVRGYYLVERVAFDAPGDWAALVTARSPKGDKALSGTMAFEVKQRTDTPAIGERVPATKNLTAADVKDLAEIDTSVPPKPELHQVSVAQALERRRPFVAVFATPAFCVSRMCGPVTEEVASLHPKYRDRVEFIHIEPYELGPLRQGGAFRLAPVTKEWNLPTEPWVFVVNAEGRLAAKFEGLVAADEVEAAVRRALA